MSEYHLRCTVCNYCRATDGPRKKVRFVYLDGSSDPVCTDCIKSIWTAEPELKQSEEDSPTTPRSLVRREETHPKPTLAGVSGVNDGPQADHSVWSTEDAVHPVPTEEESKETV